MRVRCCRWWLSDSECLTIILQADGVNDHLLVFGLDDRSCVQRRQIVLAGDDQHGCDIVRRDIDGEAGSHVEVAVHLPGLDTPVFLDEAEHWLGFRYRCDDVVE